MTAAAVNSWGNLEYSSLGRNIDLLRDVMGMRAAAIAQRRADTFAVVKINLPDNRTFIREQSWKDMTEKKELQFVNTSRRQGPLPKYITCALTLKCQRSLAAYRTIFRCHLAHCILLQFSTAEWYSDGEWEKIRKKAEHTAIVQRSMGSNTGWRL